MDASVHAKLATAPGSVPEPRQYTLSLRFLVSAYPNGPGMAGGGQHFSVRAMRRCQRSVRERFTMLGN